MTTYFEELKSREDFLKGFYSRLDKIKSEFKSKVVRFENKTIDIGITPGQEVPIYFCNFCGKEKHVVKLKGTDWYVCWDCIEKPRR